MQRETEQQKTQRLLNARAEEWRQKFVKAGFGDKESSIQQIAIDARTADNPLVYLDSYVDNLYNRLTGEVEDSDMEVETPGKSSTTIPGSTSSTSSTPFSSTTPYQGEASSEEDEPVGGLFSSTLSRKDEAMIRTSTGGSTWEAAIEEQRRQVAKPFNDASGTYKGKAFTFGGTSKGFSESSAKRHIESYIKNYGFPPGTKTVDELRTSLFQAASVLIESNTLGRKGSKGAAQYKVREGFTWFLIIEPQTSGAYSLEHVEINEQY